MRAVRRMRARFFSAVSTDESGAPIPGHELEPTETELGIADQVQPECSDEHITLREGLVKQFSIRFKRNEVEWLRFPGSVLR
jgi:hypothetical protein